MIKKIERGEYILLVGRVKVVYPISEFTREDGSVVKYRNAIVYFPTEEGKYETYKVSINANFKIFDKFQPGDLMIIRAAPEDFEGDYPIVNEEKRRIYVRTRGTAKRPKTGLFKGKEEHEKAYKIPPLEELAPKRKTNIVTLEDVLRDIEEKPDEAVNNWYNVVAHIYRIHAIYPYVSKKDGSHRIAVRLGIEQYPVSIRGITFSTDQLLEDAGMTVEEIESVLENIQNTLTDDKKNPNKELARVLDKVVGKYYKMLLRVMKDEHFDEWMVKIIRFEPVDETLVEQLVGGGE